MGPDRPVSSDVDLRAHVPAVSVARMQAMDETAIHAFAIPRLLLMEHAGLAVARAVQGCLPSPGPVLLACGGGYNGGDGLCAGRHLHAWGYVVRALLAARREALRDEPAQYAQMLEALGVEVREVTQVEELEGVGAWITGAAVIVDALLGIGMRGPVREPYASLIGRLNASGRPIVSVDAPSGLDADSGAVQGAAIMAARTVTFGRAKQGCLRGAGPAHTGQLVVDAITIPRVVLERG